MATVVQGLRLRQFPFAARMVITGFVITASLGYLVALLNLYLTYADRDGQPGLTAMDLKQSLHGDRKNTIIGAQISPGGPMAKFLPMDAEREQILTWVHSGAKEEGFAGVKPILQRRCVGCHSPSGQASFRPLTNFTEVAAVATVDTGESLAKFARIAHTHLQSLALVYLALGLLFAFCNLPEKAKALVVMLPFAGLALDFGARGLVRVSSEFVYGVMLGGALLGIGTGLMVTGILWELWSRPRKPKPRRVPVATVEPALEGAT